MHSHQAQFLNYLSQHIALTNSEFEKFFSSLSYVKITKGEWLLKPTSICRYQHFILRGLLIMYEPDDKGIEHVIHIAMENSWTGDLGSYTYETTTNRFIKAAEDCELLLLDKKSDQQLLKEIPALEKLFRILFQHAYINQTERVSMMLNSNAEERFSIFKQRFPHLVNRVEWKIIASYLDMTPETLSRVKNKLA